MGTTQLEVVDVDNVVCCVVCVLVGLSVCLLVQVAT
jgi:hypothetical protein